MKLEKFAAYYFQGRYQVERKKFMLHKVSFPKESMKSKDVEYEGFYWTMKGFLIKIVLYISLNCHYFLIEKF